MDVTQMIMSTVMPAATALPTSSEPSVGGVAPATLFGEMFAKAALTAEFSGKLSENALVQQQSKEVRMSTPERQPGAATGAKLSAPVLVMFAGEALPVAGEQEVHGLPDGQIASLLTRTLAHRQTVEESARTPEQRIISSNKSRENKGEVKVDLSAGQLEEALVPGAGMHRTAGGSTLEKNVEGSAPVVSEREMPQQKDVAEVVPHVLTALPESLVNVLVPAPVAQSVPRGITISSPDVPASSVHFAEIPAAARKGNELTREILPDVKSDTTPSLEQRSSGGDVKPDRLVAQAGFAVDATEKNLVPLVQTETTGPRNFPGNGEKIPSTGAEFSPKTLDAAGAAKTAGSEIPVSSPELKDVVDVVPVGEKMVGKDHGNVVRHENGPALKQTQHEQKLAGKGETVMRELPSGVTVLNPAQTVTMGRPEFTADAAPLVAQGTERGRISLPEGEVREEKGRQISLVGEGEKVARHKEDFASQDNTNLGHDSNSNGGNQGLSQTAGSGTFEAVVKGHLGPVSEVPREHEVSALHENILTQVREKLVSQEPSGNVSKITLKLNPHELGELQINVRLEDQKMRVDITAQNPVVKEALLQNIDQLRDSLQRQNISMERFHVSTGDSQSHSFNQSFREGRQTAYQTPDTYSYPVSGYYQEDPQVSQAAYADSRENSLVDMRF